MRYSECLSNLRENYQANAASFSYEVNSDWVDDNIRCCDVTISKGDKSANVEFIWCGEELHQALNYTSDEKACNVIFAHVNYHIDSLWEDVIDRAINDVPFTTLPQYQFLDMLGLTELVVADVVTQLG